MRCVQNECECGCVDNHVVCPFTNSGPGKIFSKLEKIPTCSYLRIPFELIRCVGLALFGNEKLYLCKFVEIKERMYLYLYLLNQREPSLNQAAVEQLLVLLPSRRWCLLTIFHHLRSPNSIQCSVSSQPQIH